jgi:hypothetical protein
MGEAEEAEAGVRSVSKDTKTKMKKQRGGPKIEVLKYMYREVFMRGRQRVGGVGYNARPHPNINIKQNNNK